MIGWLAIAVALVACIFTLLAGTAVRALREFSRSELELTCHERRSSVRLSDILIKHEETALGVQCFQALSLAVMLTFGVIAGIDLVGRPITPAVAIAFAALACFVTLAVDVWLANALARVYAAQLLCRTWPLWRVLSRCMMPLVWISYGLDVGLHLLAGRKREKPSEESFEEEIRTIVTEGHREGLLEEEAREMIEGVIQLSDVDVSHIMTPRTYVVSMPSKASFDEALKVVMVSAHTRIPLYDKNRDDVVGVLHAKDLLAELANPNAAERRPLIELARPAFFVPETKPVDDLLREFQRTRNHMAVVLDEYGGVSGVVTIEDALEEIVGEIEDEYDEDLPDGIRTIDERTAEALARVHIEDLNARLGTQLPESEDFDTVGGLVFSRVGRIPAPGDEVMIDNVRITVVDVTRRRIERVRIEVLDQTASENVQAGS